MSTQPRTLKKTEVRKRSIIFSLTHNLSDIEEAAQEISLIYLTVNENEIDQVLLRDFPKDWIFLATAKILL